MCQSPSPIIFHDFAERNFAQTQFRRYQQQKRKVQDRSRARGFPEAAVCDGALAFAQKKLLFKIHIASTASPCQKAVAACLISVA